MLQSGIHFIAFRNFAAKNFLSKKSSERTCLFHRKSIVVLLYEIVNREKEKSEFNRIHVLFYSDFKTIPTPMVPGPV